MNTREIDLLASDTAKSLTPVVQVIEGFSHLLQQQDLRPITREQVTANMEAYGRRRKLLSDLGCALGDARGAVIALLADGHPKLPSMEVNADVLEDIDNNLKALEAARETFEARAETVSGTFQTRGGQHSPRDHAGDD